MSDGFGPIARVTESTWNTRCFPIWCRYALRQHLPRRSLVKITSLCWDWWRNFNFEETWSWWSMIFCYCIYWLCNWRKHYKTNPSKLSQLFRLQPVYCTTAAICSLSSQPRSRPILLFTTIIDVMLRYVAVAVHSLGRDDQLPQTANLWHLALGVERGKPNTYGCLPMQTPD